MGFIIDIVGLNEWSNKGYINIMGTTHELFKPFLKPCKRGESESLDLSREKKTSTEFHNDSSLFNGALET